MIGDLFDLLMTPISWAVTQAIVFAVTAPYEHIYIAMGVLVLLILALIWSMIPKRQKKATSHNIEAVPVEVSDEDEAQAMEILRKANA